MSEPTPRAYRFGSFRMDLVRRRLLDADGAALELSSRAYDVLVHLIENRDHVVGKDDLMAAVWAGVIVEENTVTQAVSSLRRSLADQRGSAQYIATVAGRGYRFVADVTVETVADGRPAEMRVEPASAPPDSTPLSRRGLLAGGASLAAAGAGWFLWRGTAPSPGPTLRSIAVLPFQPLVPTADNAPLELGLADALINRLSGLPGIVVAPFSSVRAHGTGGRDPVAAGRLLNVDVVLESNIQIQPDRIRLTSRLLVVESGSAMWQGSFDAHLGDFFAVQDELARQVADALEVELTPAARRSLHRHPTGDLQAWQLYLEGRFNWGIRSPEGIKQAIALFEESLAVDPKFALAAAGLADCWAVTAVFGMQPPAEALARAREAAERAVVLDGQLAEAQASLGHVMVQGGRDWKGGEIQYLRALKLQPNYAQAVFWLANNCAFQGRLRDALAYGRQTQTMEPMSVVFAANVGMLEYYARDFAAARATLSPLVQAMPNYPLARRFLARLLMVQGETREALALLDGREAEYAPGCHSDMGRALAVDGQRQAARREVDRLERLGEDGFGVGYDIALILTALGEREPALAALERSLADGSQMVGFMNSEPGFDPIRTEPRFKAVSRHLGLG
jgi:DNA-binding winged helix-turn-helix (wHTH) protein/TolB-like protein/tetratricopeptide (TPR) repeat protein